MPAVVGICIGRLLGKRTVSTYHGGGGDRFFARRHKLVHYWLTRTDCNIVLNGFLAKVFNDHNLPYTVIPNIIELNENQYRLRETLRPQFICTRAHEPLYNIPCILQAFYRVQAVFPEAKLTLVGNGSQHNALVQMTTEMGLRNVFFTGRVDNSQIYNYLDQADIIISASTQDNMPVSLLEAMNAGLLVISSRVGGIPYMVEENSTGLLFESDNYAELAEKMIWAVENPGATMAITQKAHCTVSQYRWENIKDKIYIAYGISA
jgi:glycosyltransferase involved in cell wall biosynthesis